MLIQVDSLYGDLPAKLMRHGWRRHVRNKAESGALDAKEMDRVCGKIFEKDFSSMGAAMREFELATGEDAIAVEDHDGAAVYTFYCVEQQLVVSGWECGKYLYEKWCETPRQCLEALNAPQ